MKKVLALIIFSVLLMGQTAMAKTIELPNDADLVKCAQAGAVGAQVEVGDLYCSGLGFVP